MRSADRADAPLAAVSITQRAPGESPAFAAFDGRRPAVAISAVILAGLTAIAYGLHLRGHAALGLTVVFGSIFGIVLQRARFCFFCMYRDWTDARDPRGLIGLLVALATGLIGTTIVFGAWLPDASTGRLPPDAFIAPVSLALVAAGLAFGAGMAISGSCVSAHLYRLGEGSPTAPFALLGTLVGFALGFVTWNPIYLAFVSDAPIVWLPRWLGYAGALAMAFAVLAGIAYAITRNATRASRSESDFKTALLVDRWPVWIGGAIIGALATASYFRVAPLGVTAEIGGRARQIANYLNIAPTRLEGLDTLRGCVAVIRDAVLSQNGVFVLSLVAASFAAALVAGQFKPSRPTAGHVGRGLSGGLLLGWGAMTGLGCTIGTLLSGITAGSLSGWVFGAAIFAGTSATLWIGRRLRWLPQPS